MAVARRPTVTLTSLQGVEMHQKQAQQYCLPYTLSGVFHGPMRDHQTAQLSRPWPAMTTQRRDEQSTTRLPSQVWLSRISALLHYTRQWPKRQRTYPANNNALCNLPFEIPADSNIARAMQSNATLGAKRFTLV